MKSKKERLIEFVKYHIMGDGECNNVVLREWARVRNLNFQQRYELAFLFSVTYCVESAIILFEKQRKAGRLNTTQLEAIKSKIVFQSDRKYMRMRDSFERCMSFFYQHNHDGEKFLDGVSSDGVIDLEKAIKTVSQWVMFGRFSAFLFLETLVELTECRTKNTTIEWAKGDTATSGLLNLYGYDEQADMFDKTGRLSIPTADMDRMLGIVSNCISQAGGNTNVTEIETSLCAYRKFYKGSRYNGYYLDRMLEEIYKMECEFPTISSELLGIRRRSFPAKYLGEIGGWRGVRKSMKKYYLNTGLVN